MVLVNKKFLNADIDVFLSLLVMSLFPNFIYVCFETSSLAVGFFLASVFVLFVNYKQSRALHSKAICGVLVFSIILVFHSLYVFYFSEQTRPLSALLLVVVVLTLPFFSSKLAKMEFVHLDNALKIFIHILSVVGWVGIIYVFAHGGRMKYPFPFSEPSLFALCYGMFAVGYCFVASRKFAFYIVVNLLFFSFLFPSLTSLLFAVIVALTIFMRLQSFWFLIGGVVFSVLVFAVGYFFISDIEYFSSRLDFSGAENITTLVWLQGWDLSYINLVFTEWRGLGFQMLGMEGGVSDISYKLEGLTGKFMNMSSGGFLAAKLISEFGIFGVGVSLLYVLFVIYFCFSVGMSSRRKFSGCAEKKKIVFQGFALGYIVEFFFRGYGYFSPSLYIVIAALLAVWHINSISRSMSLSSRNAN